MFIVGKCSDAAAFKYGVPQGAVLGPTLCSDYSYPMAVLTGSRDINVQCYADDPQVYVFFQPEKKDETLVMLVQCIEDLRERMSQN